MPVASLLPTQKTVDTNNRYHEPMSRDQQNAQGPLGSGSQARRYGGLDSRTDTRPRVHSHPVERDAPISLDHVQMIQVGGDELPVLGWKERVRHFTWTWFTLTMATGGIANVIHNGQCIIFLNIFNYQDSGPERYTDTEPSTTPIHWFVRDRMLFLHFEPRSFRLQLCVYGPALLPLAVYLPCLFLASNRVPVCSSFYNKHCGNMCQYLRVRNESRQDRHVA